MSKVALVTGASRGIGKEIALTLGKAGYTVVVNYVSNQTSAEEVVASIKGAGGQAISYKANIADGGRTSQMVKEVLAQFSSIDLLVNNAGITRDNLLIRMSEQEWKEVIDTNFLGVIHLSNLALESMKTRQKGKIINIASTVGVHGNAGQANYSAAKSALISYTKIMARELMPFIQVNAIAPGLVKTDMTAKFDLEKLAQTKLGRAALPQDIASCALWLAEASGDYVTGQTIEIDGGLFLCGSVEELVS
ncbi:MAG: 3-oxoacyl-ACP reductase family protein [Candidatus Caenarcaniphilales bacterium]|nr:3-oxoacyl-ACP reductase family protein [Candidatus Caenarcaniphilales bacterium]